MKAARLRSGMRRVAALQFPFFAAPNLEAVREYLLKQMLKAQPHKPLLIVLPALTGLMPLRLLSGNMPQFNAAFREDCLRYGLAAEESLLDWARVLARTFDAYLVPGSSIVPGEDGLVHKTYLFDPDGQLIGEQAQTHVTPQQRAVGIVPADQFQTWDLEGIRVGIALDADACWPEVGRILALMGASVVINPSAGRLQASQVQQYTGAWQLAQSNQLFVIEAALTGVLGDDRFNGHSTVYAPYALTPRGDGIVAQGPSRRKAAAVIGDLDFRALFRLRREQPIAHRFHHALYRQHFPQRYRDRLAQVQAGGDNDGAAFSAAASQGF